MSVFFFPEAMAHAFFISSLHFVSDDLLQLDAIVWTSSSAPFRIYLRTWLSGTRPFDFPVASATSCFRPAPVRHAFFAAVLYLRVVDAVEASYGVS